MIRLYRPEPEDLWFKQTMLADEETMAYNHARGGTIRFDRDRWDAWYKKWLCAPEQIYFYRYLADAESGEFLGEIAYHPEEGLCMADVLVYAPHRRRGIGREGLRLLCEQAKVHRIYELYDRIAADNPSIVLFEQEGFICIRNDPDGIMVKKIL